jgi:hypothetical protein
MKIKREDILRLEAKHRRENFLRLKPMVQKDKKKEANKKQCRKWQM